MVLATHKAWESYAHFTQEQVDRIVAACAQAASDAAYELAKLAVDETGYGVVEHKFIKNKFASDDIHEFIRGMKTVGIIREIPERKVSEIAEPLGVVAAVIPSTNPTSTAIYKILISLKSRNGVVLSPHPSAKKCINRTAEIMKKAAVAAGAPEGIVDCMTENIARWDPGADKPSADGGHPRYRRHGARARSLQLRQTGVRGGTGETCPPTSSRAPTFPRRYATSLPERVTTTEPCVAPSKR